MPAMRSGWRDGRMRCNGAPRTWAARSPTPSPPPLGYPAPAPAIDLLTTVDDRMVRAAAALRSAPLTAVMTLLSAWWVKGIAIAALGAAADLRRRPLRIPPTPLLAT